MRELHEWFLRNRREFPWRQHPTPYKVWISEVMLQQTRASVVVSYFERWLILFPDVRALAAAPLEKVIKAWEGLGYYSRARNLHRGAQQIVERFGGEIPSNREDLASICGLGPYTVGAILSFGFKQRAAAVDGNVSRVLARYLSLEEDIDRLPSKQKIASAAEALLDPEKPWVTAEALIELGATVCTLKPKCQQCPLQKGCLGQGKAESLPIKRTERPITHLKRAVTILEAEEKILVQKRKAGQIMADLYEFPYFEMENGNWTQKEIEEAVQRVLGLEAIVVERLSPVIHTFTRFKAHLYPVRCRTELKQVEGYQWVTRSALSELPFSSGHRKIYQL